MSLEVEKFIRSACYTTLVMGGEPGAAGQDSERNSNCVWYDDTWNDGTGDSRVCHISDDYGLFICKRLPPGKAASHPRLCGESRHPDHQAIAMERSSRSRKSRSSHAACRSRL